MRRQVGDRRIYYPLPWLCLGMNTVKLGCIEKQSFRSKDSQAGAWEPDKKDETIQRWSKNLLKEMLAEKRAQHRRSDADKGER
ncbi:MAG: hypothetical protein D3916_13105 [Candidatus Electrothrix sp. MAN1_4]|nr:hypothetical protein [Candidatus Electrothrix sp. MAN1_4]